MIRFLLNLVAWPIIGFMSLTVFLFWLCAVIKRNAQVDFFNQQGNIVRSTVIMLITVFLLRPGDTFQLDPEHYNRLDIGNSSFYWLKTKTVPTVTSSIISQTEKFQEATTLTDEKLNWVNYYNSTLTIDNVTIIVPDVTGSYSRSRHNWGFSAFFIVIAIFILITASLNHAAYKQYHTWGWSFTRSGDIVRDIVV